MSKEYQKEYKKSYKSKNKIVTFPLSTAFHDELKRRAIFLDLKTNSYAKSIITAFLNDNTPKILSYELPSAKDLHLYCLLDEFGNMNIPRFSSVITTIRKYNVSISIILQNINQLIKQYSQNEAKTILDGGIASKLIYSGADLDLSSDLEKMFGFKETLKKQADGRDYYDKESVMNVSEIRTMKDSEALFVYANKKPLKMSVKPYYKDMMYNGFSKMKPYKITSVNRYDNVQYVDLENVEW